MGDDSDDDDKKMHRRKRVRDTRLYVKIRDDQWPVVYDDIYNIGFLGLEKLHPFDSRKWGNVFKVLKEAGMLDEDLVVHPQEATRDDLLVVHSKTYLATLQCPCEVARAVEVGVVSFIPNCLIDRYLLRPMRYQTGGTILASRLALDRGWAINIGGGFHHARANRGGGFCVYADISLALNFLFIVRRISSAMIVDLDAHQGNGHELDFAHDDRVYIFDMFNYEIYPRDYKAKESINRSVRLESGTSGATYLRLLRKELTAALDEFRADLIVYNAGTDSLAGDPLGLLSLSPEAIIQRDQMVFEMAANHSAPIVMVTSGGYLRESARVIADSILNLHAKRIIKLA
ncbi:histone deacetylase 11-like protein [Aphelenchoides avenae]|nr:histone deacetylase 11-like protein [Aphelenchus avenae]